MKKIALITAFNFAFIFGTTSCIPGLSAGAGLVATYIQSGMLVIDTVKSFTDHYFRTHVNTELEHKITNAINKTQIALHAALEATQGVDKLSQGKIDEAFEPFKMAYIELMVLIGPLNVNAKGSKLVKEADGSLTIPLPLALVPKAK